MPKKPQKTRPLDLERAIAEAVAFELEKRTREEADRRRERRDALLRRMVETVIGAVIAGLLVGAMLWILGMN